MKVTRLYIEAKRSCNFQTYTVGFDVEIEKDSDEGKDLTTNKVRELQAKARKLCDEQIALDKPQKINL